VLPVKQLSENEFEIRFATSLALNSDAIVDIITKEQKTGLLPEKYIVNVYDGANNLVYAYSMPLNNGEVPPCLGRPMPEGNYRIMVSLANSSNTGWVSAGALPLFLLFGWQVYANKRKPGNDKPANGTEKNFIPIGSIKYYPVLQKLEIKGSYMCLTAKETRVLGIFAENINTEIAREHLQKEVWEDEGVIVGRSLDMFISKLRKKLSGVPGIKIVSIHGKGYKLIVEDALQ
jgi:hypothetical protein